MKKKNLMYALKEIACFLNKIKKQLKQHKKKVIHYNRSTLSQISIDNKISLAIKRFDTKMRKNKVKIFLSYNFVTN